MATLKGFLGGDVGIPTVPHYFQCGGGRSGATLDIVGGRRVRRLGKGGAISHHLFLCI